MSGFLEKLGFFEFFQGGDVSFWVKNWVRGVRSQGLGKVGKKKMVKNA